MELWIDNTGLQSAALCLEGRASPMHEYDARGLLQLATQIIYGEKISLNGFEDEKIANRSKEVVERLQSLYSNEKIININPIGVDEYALACKTAADMVAPDLRYSFNPDEYKLLGGEPPDLPRGFKERLVSFVKLAIEPVNSEKLDKVLEESLKDKAVGAIEFMLASSPSLREAIAKMVKEHKYWNDRHSYQLNIFLRYHLNDSLAEQSFAKYSPAVARAELINRRSQFILDALSKEMDEVVSDLRRGPLGIPSTFAALLQRSKGEPEAILKVALEFREYSKPLRNALENLSNEHWGDTDDSREEIQKEIWEMGHQLRRNFKERSTKLGDAIEFRFVLGIPTVFISGKELVRWVRERYKKRRIAVLTELVKASAFSEFNTDLYKKFRKLSARKSK